MSLISLLLSKSAYGCTSTIHRTLINVTSESVSIKGKYCFKSLFLQTAEFSCSVPLENQNFSSFILE